jgi:amino acid transporter
VEEEKLGTFSLLSIGIGGMVGGGIFAVTGLTVEITHGAAPIAFAVAGVVALLTSYSYLRLTLAFPSGGGTVAFLNRAYGSGMITGATNILLCLSYVVLLAVYAYAFASYAASFHASRDAVFWRHVYGSGVLIGLALLNFLGAALVVRSEDLFNAAKLLLLGAFLVAGFASPLDWSRLAPAHYPPAPTIVAGAMLIFLNYEGFELIANAGPDARDPRRSLPVAYVGGVLLVIAIYVAIATVVVGGLDFARIAATSDYVLSTAAEGFAGRAGFVVIGAAALLATSSAINATFYGSGRLTYTIARSGELPAELERGIRGQPLEGMIAFTLLGLLVVNFVPLRAIATMGSAGFLIVFLAINVANVRLAAETRSRVGLSALGALACAVALVALCWDTEKNRLTRDQLWILVGMVALSLAIEVAYRRATGRHIRLLHGRPGAPEGAARATARPH